MRISDTCLQESIFVLCMFTSNIAGDSNIV